MRNFNYKSQRCPITGSLSPNSILDRDRYHVSYNPRSDGYGCDTTAIVLDNHVFLVLNGNHSDNLESCTDLESCLSYFIDNIEKANKLSEHHIISGRLEDQFGIVKNALRIIGAENVERLRNA